MKFLSRNTKSIDSREIARVAKAFDLHPVVAELLISRDLSSNLEEFLYSCEIYDPFLLNDMGKAVECIKEHISKGHKITVYGDYDVDGVCSSAIMYRYFKSVNANVEVFLPDRNKDGYGLNNDCIDDIAKNGTNLIITVDCGISNFSEVAHAIESGIDVVVTDHHQCPEVLPKCSAVINPLLANYPFRNICGCGVALMLVYALGGIEEFNKYVDLAAIATVADIVSLVDENREIVKRGLKRINSDSCNAGIRAICSVAGLTGDITAGNIAFGIAPRINAAGRMYQAREAFEVLICDDYDTAIKKAEVLNMYNGYRKTEEASILKEAIHDIEQNFKSNNRIIIVCGEKWNKGVIGIVASKLVEKYGRPVIVFSEDNGICVGSGRSITGIHLFNLLNCFGNMFIKFGGHEMAAGMSINACNVNELNDKLNKYIEKNYSDELFIPTMLYDIELDIKAISLKLAEDIQLLSPMGMGNRTPVFKLSDVEIVGARLIGQDKNHIKMSVIKDGVSFDAVGFSFGDRINEIKGGCSYDLLFNVEINSWENRNYVQLQLKEFKPNLEKSARAIVAGCGETYFDSLLQSANMPIERVNHSRIRHMWNWDIYLGRRLKKDVLGTVIYSSVPTCSYELLDFLAKGNLLENVDFYVGFPKDNSCIVLAPDWDRDELNYSRLVIFDYAPTEFINIILSKNKHIQIVICHNDHINNKLLNFSMGLDFERDKAAIYYSIIKSIGNCKFTIDEFVAKFCELGKETPFNAYYALNVFSELGIINIDDDKVIINECGEKKNLLSSNIIKCISSLKDKIFDELELIIPKRKIKGN